MQREWCYYSLHYLMSGLHCCSCSEALDVCAAPMGTLWPGSQSSRILFPCSAKKPSWRPEIQNWNVKWSPSLLAPSHSTPVQDWKERYQKMMTETPIIFLLLGFATEDFCRATFRHPIKNYASRFFFYWVQTCKKWF